MNAKIEDMKNLFDEKLHELYKTNQVISKQIYQFEKICELTNNGIKPSEMNCEDIISKLQIIEDDPMAIWRCIQKYFGYGFFNVMIQKEFGINPYTHEEVTHKFTQQVNSLKDHALDKLAMIEQTTQERYQEVKEKYEEYERKLQIQQSTHDEEVRTLKIGLDKVLKETTEKIKLYYFQKYDSQIHDLYENIKLLKSQLAKAKGIKPNMDEINREISMFDKGKKGLTLVDYPEDEKDLLINRLNQELHSMTADYRDEMTQKENYKFLAMKAEKDREFLVRQINMYKSQYEYEKERFREFKANHQNAEKKMNSLIADNKAAKSLNENLEDEVATLRGQFILLERIIPKERLASFERQNPFPLLVRRNQVAKNDINNKARDITKNLYRDANRDQGSLTELYDLK